MNPKVQWGIWVANTGKDNIPQWFGHGHTWHIYPSKEQAKVKALELESVFGYAKYSARKYVKRS